MQCQYGRDRKGIDRYRKGKGRERLEQMSIPPTLLPVVVQKLFPNEVSFGVDIGR